tara:strand:+ start:912 stop:1361 length:450 start_codon:yes stop_codon:yes gene_type:complete
MYYAIKNKFNFFQLKSKFRRFLKICILSSCFTLLSIFFLLLNFNIKSVDASVIENDKLIEKISNDFTRKFCNSIAFGLSKESAMNFANKENNLIFKSKTGMDSLNKELLSNKIATKVVETCGFSIELKGYDGISKFENDYISINSSNSN